MGMGGGGGVKGASVPPAQSESFCILLFLKILYKYEAHLHW